MDSSKLGLSLGCSVIIITDKRRNMIWKIQIHMFCHMNIFTLSLVLCSCDFKAYHNKKLHVTPSAIIETVHVGGGAQCKLKCKAYNGQCSGVNLKFSEQRATFECELLENVHSILGSNLSTDDTCTFMEMLGKLYCFCSVSIIYKQLVMSVCKKVAEHTS